MNDRGRVALHALLFLSGSAGLAYQTIWTKTFTVALGHELPSLLAVVAAFFAGLSLGAWQLGAWLGRSARPHTWYAVFEVLIAAWAIASLFLVPVANDVALSVLGVDPHPATQWLLTFMLPFGVLLPATFAMGATLPAMEQVIARRAAHGRVVGGAYAANTAGAVIGVVAGAFWLLPELGQQGTLLVFAGVNLLCAVGMVWLSPGPTEPVQVNPIGSHAERNREPVSWLLLATGLLGIGYEVLAVRIMSQVFEGTLYSFATALAVYLAASSAGAAAFHRYAQRVDVRVLLPRLLLGLGYSCLLGLLVLYAVEDIYRSLRLATGDTVRDVFFSELLLAVCVFVLPSALMGMTFALLAQRARESRGEVGRAFGINTLGGALAPFAFGIVLLPLVGAKWAVGVVALGYLALVPIVAPVETRKRALAWLAPAVALALMPPLQIMTLRDGERVLAYREGVMAAAAVVERGAARNLRVNNRYQMGGTSAEALLFQRRQAHIPILLHPSPREAVFLGVASGATLGAAAEHAELQVDAVELVPEVLALMGYFSPANGAPERQPNVTLHASDARRFVRASERRYDVIVADLYHPARDGAGLLFTREHYAAIAERLDADGVFCHWLPLHQLDMEMIELITRTFLSVFPDAHAVLASDLLKYPALGLMTGFDTGLVGNGYLKQRVTRPRVRESLQRVLLSNDLQLFSTVLLGPAELADLAGDGPLNTDDRPLLSYLAPRFTYDRGSVPYARLMQLVDRYQPQIVRGIDERRAAEATFIDRFRQYVEARNLYLRGLRIHVEEGEEAALPLYLESARTSRDHRTSVAQLFRIASELSDHSPTEALAIAERLLELRPDLAAVSDLHRRLQARVRTGGREH